MQFAAILLEENGPEETAMFLVSCVGVQAPPEIYAAMRGQDPGPTTMPSSPRFGPLSRTAMRDLDMTSRQWRKAVEAGGPVVRQLARGLRNPDEQMRYAREVEKKFG
jgi:hypothetical protein